jgi:hypothetical protein
MDLLLLVASRRMSDLDNLLAELDGIAGSFVCFAPP